MNRFWVIGDSKKAFFWKKSVFYFFIKLFLHTFFQKRTFCYPTTFFESLITHKRFDFQESYILYGRRQKSCTLIVVSVKCMYLTSPTFNSSAKSNRLFLLQTRKYFFVWPFWLILTLAGVKVVLSTLPTIHKGQHSSEKNSFFIRKTL